MQTYKVGFGERNDFSVSGYDMAKSSGFDRFRTTTLVENCLKNYYFPQFYCFSRYPDSNPGEPINVSAYTT
jgi:hypothetical protein